jgi:hypothetical protein
MHTVLDEHAGVHTGAASIPPSEGPPSPDAPPSPEPLLDPPPLELPLLEPPSLEPPLLEPASLEPPLAPPIVASPLLEPVLASITGSTTGTLVSAPAGGGSLIIPAPLTCDIGAQ